jgi:hypothetical protein
MSCAIDIVVSDTPRAFRLITTTITGWWRFVFVVVVVVVLALVIAVGGSGGGGSSNDDVVYDDNDDAVPLVDLVLVRQVESSSTVLTEDREDEDSNDDCSGSRCAFVWMILLWQFRLFNCDWNACVHRQVGGGRCGYCTCAVHTNDDTDTTGSNVNIYVSTIAISSIANTSTILPTVPTEWGNSDNHSHRGKG